MPGNTRQKPSSHESSMVDSKAMAKLCISFRTMAQVLTWHLWINYLGPSSVFTGPTSFPEQELGWPSLSATLLGTEEKCGPRVRSKKEPPSTSQFRGAEV